MERRRTHDTIEHLHKRQVQKIAGNEAKARIEPCTKMLPRILQHILREIDSDYATPGQQWKQLPGKASSAATRIQHEFIAAKPQACQNFLSPSCLWG